MHTEMSGVWIHKKKIKICYKYSSIAFDKNVSKEVLKELDGADT